MKYLLDTNICIYLIKKKPIEVIKKLSELNINDIGISSITLSELEYGVEKSSNPERNKIALIEFLSMIEIYDYDDKAAKEYGKIRTELEKKGIVIGSLDMLIAAHAKSRDMILVTNNEREFKRIKELLIENWVKW
jgi:tRNA(fMet)-specific endonuclease VapC